MQTELIIVSEYCHKCHIEPSFIDLLEEGGLIEVRTEGGEHYLLASQLPDVERYSRMELMRREISTLRNQLIVFKREGVMEDW